MQFSGVTMTGGYSVLTGAAPVGDQYWANVSFLSETVSTNGQTNNTFLDSSSAALSISRFGSPTQGSVTPFTVASGSSYNTSTNGGSSSFAGGGEYLNSAASAGLSFNGDFTIECWVNTSTISLDPYGRRIWSFGSGAGTNVLDLDFYNGSSITTNACLAIGNIGTVIVGTIAVADGNWHHVAVTRSGSSIKLFVDGVQSGSTYTSSATFADGATNGMYIGSLGGVGGYFVGNISSLRVVKGTAVYTSAFTPPTSPLTAISGTSLLLNFTNAGMYDATTKNNMLSVGTTQASTTVSKWSPTSAYFNGSSSCLYAQPNTAFAFGTGDFTVEGWVYFNSVSSNQPFCQSDAIGNSTNNKWYFLYAPASNKLLFGTHNSGGFDCTIPFSPSTGTWYYVTAVRSSGTMYLFVNGVSGTVTTTGASSPNGYNLGQGGLTVGGLSTPPTNTYLNGYIQDLRLTKGVARYTATFTPPTAALPTSA
jgi:Concanavalin A-like lectin/glucanases superfamily